MVLDRGPKWALWMSPCHLGVTIECYCLQNGPLLSYQGATGYTCVTLCKDECGQDHPAWYSVGDVGWGTTPALSKTPAVSLNKRHSPPQLNLLQGNNSPSCQELGKVTTCMGWCLEMCSWCEHQPLKPRCEWCGACRSQFPVHSEERVYLCSIRTVQSTWHKSTLSIKGYLKLIEIKSGHLPSTMTNPLHPPCREPRFCTFP